MKRLSHSKIRLSMQLLGAAALAATLGFASMAGSTPASGASESRYFGRWQVNDPDARFSTRGRVYKVIDIAPCGRDFCGVSVADNGSCGATLFRFYSRRRSADRLEGHGLWGTVKKDITLESYEGATEGVRNIDLYLGNGHDFGERSGSMPMFNASYARSGEARCRTR